MVSNTGFSENNLCDPDQVISHSGPLLFHIQSKVVKLDMFFMVP